MTVPASNPGQRGGKNSAISVFNQRGIRAIARIERKTKGNVAKLRGTRRTLDHVLVAACPDIPLAVLSEGNIPVRGHMLRRPESLEYIACGSANSLIAAPPKRSVIRG